MYSAGLTSEEAARRLAQVGPNALPSRAGRSLARRWVDSFRSPLVWVLLAALAVDLVGWILEGARGAPIEAFAIGAILLLNAALGVVQEGRAEQALERLKSLSGRWVLALRDGSLVRVDPESLVPEDRVRVDAGDRIPADGVLVRSGEGTGGVAIDESILTGESVPAERGPGEPCSAGTLVVRGVAWLDVEQTGPRSALGRLAGAMAAMERTVTPLERRIRWLGNRIALWVLGISAAITVAGLAVLGLSYFAEVFLVAVALAVAAIPEGLPIVLTLTLALGVERMAKRAAVVRRLNAVEALGSVTVVAVDKTGTLTENQMEVRGLALLPGVEVARRADLVLALANEADPEAGGGDPMERALLRAAELRIGRSLADVVADFPRLELRPFDPARRRMSVTVREEDGSPITLIKGAPEELIAACVGDDEERASWRRSVEEAAADGLRVLGLAWSPGSDEESPRWLGSVHLWDPPRKEVPGALADAKAAGIRLLMVTGDHPETAAAVARAVGVEEPKVALGAELEGLPPSTLARRVAGLDVVARSSPETKLALVEALQGAGEVVAMTGDGVNDALALKRADVGVAMGRRGSDVAREAAELVILDDDFSTLVAAIEEGRGIYENIRKFLRFLAATNLSELVVVVLGTAVLLAVGGDAKGEIVFPLTAVQILWINLITDSAPALALALDRNPGMLRRPPRARDEPLFGGAQLRFVLAGGLSIAGVALATWWVATWWGMGAVEARTALFLALVIGQLLFAWPSRLVGGEQRPNPALWAAIGGALALQALAVAVPVLRDALGLAPPSFAMVGLGTGAGLLCLLLAWLLAWWFARNGGLR